MFKVPRCCGPVKGITWNKYIERKYKYNIGKSVERQSDCQSVKLELTYKALCFNVTQGRMRLELTRVGLLVQLANRYTTRGAQAGVNLTPRWIFSWYS